MRAATNPSGGGIYPSDLDLHKTTSHAGRGNNQMWIPWCNPPGMSLEGPQQPPAMRSVRWAMARELRYRGAPVTPTHQGRRRGMGGCSRRVEALTASKKNARQRLPWAASPGRSRRKAGTKNKKKFKCSSTQHKAICLSPACRSTPAAHILLLNALTNLWGLILKHLFAKGNICFRAVAQYRTVVKSLERM